MSALRTSPETTGFWHSSWQHRVLAAHRVRPVKNVDLALDGLEPLANEDSRVRLLIMGPVIDKTYGLHILQRIKALPWVVYIGEVSHTEISGVFTLGDVVMNCSEAEGQPQAALEAMSLGVPAILSDVPGNRSIIKNGREGFYIRTSRDLYQAARILLTRPALRQEMGQAAAELVKARFDYTCEIRQHIEIYKKALGVSRIDRPAAAPGLLGPVRHQPQRISLNSLPELF